MRVPGLAAWLARVAPRTARGEVAIAIVADTHIRTLNRRYRGKDAPTDVLSFPSTPHPPSRSALRWTGPPSRSALRWAGAVRPAHLGDIVIAQGVARRQARAARHSYAAELKVLALHGLLHLLGYDHHHPGDRAKWRNWSDGYA